MDRTSLPIRRIESDPPEVLAAGGKGFVLLGEEVSERLAYQHAGYIRLQFVRRKWARLDPQPLSLADELAGLRDQAPPQVLIGPLPDSVWPRYMADPSAIANVILSKYGDCLPLHRQERISRREGFCLPRSTQCGWLTGAYNNLYRITDAMFAEARDRAWWIATDATGAPVKGEGGCDSWHVFVFVAEQDHIVFRHTREHTGEAIRAMLRGYRGRVVADASNVYDKLYTEDGMLESGCWSHVRKYFWKAIKSDPERAYEAMAVIAKLFHHARACADLPLPQRTKERAARAGPYLELLDRWLEDNRDKVDPRGPMSKALTYHDNQRQALRRFLGDGRLPLSNNVSERALRNLVLGRKNWLYFRNETGLKWYCVFRSLIASCPLHDLNPQLYLEQVLRLAPHWPVTRALELSPRYWRRTVDRLTPQQREILRRPWELQSNVVTRTSGAA